MAMSLLGGLPGLRAYGKQDNGSRLEASRGRIPAARWPGCRQDAASAGPEKQMCALPCNRPRPGGD